MSTKLTPKSCSCRTCTRCKATEGGNFMMKKEERAHRHAVNQAVRIKGTEADFHPLGRRAYVG